MDYRNKIINYLEENNGIITTQYCMEEGIPTIYLTRLMGEKVLTRIDRGIYSSNVSNHDDYYVFQFRYKRVVFSYETALYLHGLTDKIPQIMEVSVPYSYKINNVPKHVRVYYVKNEISQMGICKVKTNFGNEVRAYNMERIVCDFIQNKNDIDPEIFIKTIRIFATSKKHDLEILYDYARRMRIIEKVRNTLELIYE
jgi:predicted transcriptional regulator of viral defense system